MTNVMSYYRGYAAALKRTKQASATSDLHTYVTLAREIDKQQVALNRDVAKLLSDRLSSAEKAASTVFGLRWVGRLDQRLKLRLLMEESKALRSRLINAIAEAAC